MTGAALPDVIDSLVSLLTAALPTATVTDGPPLEDGYAALEVHVGAQLDDADAPAGSSDLAWAWLGHVQRDESGSVQLVVTAWTGDSAFKPARDRVFEALGTIETVIAADPSLGGVCINVTSVTLGDLIQQVDAQGVRVYITPTINYHARP